MTELLANELNIRINQDAILGSGLTIRGLSGNNVKILVDGIPVIGRMGGNIDLSQLNLYNVDHVEMVEGPMSTTYGSNALAGAINIITKENRRNRLEAGLHSYYESVGVYNLDGNISLKRKKNTFGLTVGRNFFSGFSVVDSLRSQLWKPKEQYNGELAYSYQTGNMKLKYQASAMTERLLQKGDLLPPYFETAFDSWFKTLRLVNRMEIKDKISGRFSYSVLGSYSYYSREKETFFKDLTNLEEVLSGNASDQDTTWFDASVLRAVSEYSFNTRISLQAGLDINYEQTGGKRIENKKQHVGD